MNHGSWMNHLIRPDAGRPGRGVMDVYKDLSLRQEIGRVASVAEIGVNEGVWGKIRQHFGEGPVPRPLGMASYEMGIWGQWQIRDWWGKPLLEDGILDHEPGGGCDGRTGRAWG